MTEVGFTLLDRLTTEEHPYGRMGLRFEGSTLLAQCKSKSLIDAVIRSIKTGSVFNLWVGSEKMVFTAGMIDLRNEPWEHKSPLFFAYQIQSESLESSDNIVATFVGEILHNGRSVALRQTKGLLIPASTTWVDSLRTMWEWYIGFMDYVVEHDDKPAFDTLVATMKAGKVVKVATSKLVGGLGYARFPYYPWYFVTQLERVYPWQRSEAIWPRGHYKDEPSRHLYHGGFRITNAGKKDEEPRMVAYRAAGYFFGAESRGGAFHHDGKVMHSFGNDVTAGGLLPLE